MSVIFSELIFLFAIAHFLHVFFFAKHPKYTTSNALAIAPFVFLQFGFILVDSIHFQYNSFMQGILILSLTQLYQKKFIQGGLLFAILLNFKHIFLYSAPAVFFFILKLYCFDNQNQKRFNFSNFLKIGVSVLGVFFISFLPFLDLDIIKQIFSRLFPFQRGLVHAYWAPNFWSLYCFGDKILYFIGKRVLKMAIEQRSTLSSGVVQVTQFDILPDIQPIYTILLILLISLPLWFRILKSAKRENIFLYSSIQMFIFYMFGFHVHEKAILLPLGIYQLWAIGKPSRSRYVLLFSFVSGVGLLPLLPQHQETGLKLVGLFCFHIAYWAFLKRDSCDAQDSSEIKMDFFSKTVILLGTIVAIYGNILHQMIFSQAQNKYEFFPLMMHSVFGGVLNIYFLLAMYIELYKTSDTDSSTEMKQLI